MSMDSGAGGRDSGDGTLHGRVRRGFFSHASALMCIVLTAVDKREGQACTEKPCTWTKPRTKKVKYDELSNIFTNKEKVAIQDHLAHETIC